MRRLFVLAFAFLVAAASVEAQTVIASVDFRQVNLGGQVINFEPVDDDGDPTTTAWLLTLTLTAANGTTQNAMRLVVQNPDGSLCMEAPFNPFEGLSPFASMDVIRLGTRDMLKVIYTPPFGPAPKALIRSLDRDICR